MTGPAVVIGNGPSRLGLDLGRLRGLATVMGCNAIYRDHPWVDFVGCVDSGISEEIFASGFPRERVVHQYRYEEKRTIVDPCGTVSRVVRDRNFATGPMMLSFALERGHDPVWLVGMDASHVTVYAGTANYDEPNSLRAARAEEPEWIAQLRRIVLEHPGVRVERIGGEIAGVPVPGTTWDRALGELSEVAAR